MTQASPFELCDLHAASWSFVAVLFISFCHGLDQNDWQKSRTVAPISLHYRNGTKGLHQPGSTLGAV
jgi:hypothetical protein